MREDDLRLFGFSTKRDRSAFKTMLKISGVGPKLALAVLGALSGDQLANAIRDGDAKRLSAIPGIGKKTAERMILELGGKLLPQDSPGNEGQSGVILDLSSALKNLGFKAAQVDRILGEFKKRNDVDSQPFDVLLREALGLLQGK